ncbi:MAG: PspA/IM30 family protein [Sphaerochaetaceae bacterium]|nr:PspA/IM30 family protein [Sphaerochaetaceae bacterium]
MGVFSRFMDIVNSNINALLDQAEDPEKMIKLMINEMEDTIIEIKTNCAAAMGSENTAKRKIADLEALIERWQKRAELAISKGREDLAREALLEKKNLTKELEALKEESDHYDQLVEKYKQDIAKLEEKLAGAAAKYQAMREKAKAEAEKAKTSKKAKEDPIDRFDRMEERIDEMNMRKETGKKSTEDMFKDLEAQASIEDELEELKKKING